MSTLDALRMLDMDDLRNSKMAHLLINVNGTKDPISSRGAAQTSEFRSGKSLFYASLRQNGQAFTGARVP
jgi:hypothetical protein